MNKIHDLREVRIHTAYERVLVGEGIDTGDLIFTQDSPVILPTDDHAIMLMGASAVFANFNTSPLIQLDNGVTTIKLPTGEVYQVEGAIPA